MDIIDKPSSRRRAQMWKIPKHTSYATGLRQAAGKWFTAKGFTAHSKMAYCLDQLDNWNKNIILDEVAEYIEKFKNDKYLNGKPFPLHKYVHHGLSSQAMVFNLIGPMIAREDYSPLIQVLKNKGINLNGALEAEFEYEDRTVFNEDTGQPTSIDLVLNIDDQPVVFLESKLAEPDFGGCSVFSKGDCNGRNPVNSKDECYLHFIGRQYWTLLDKHGFSELIRNEKICMLINYYQFFRELLLSIEKNGHFVLLYDERSPVFYYNKSRGLIPFLMEFVPAQHHNRIHLVSIQEMADAVSQSPGHQDWIGSFREKYGLATK